MPACEFNERQYEFCINYQLQIVWGAYLVGGMPTIPSQVEEAATGYDAAYRLRGGRTLFLQYKVAHYAPRAWGRGAATFRLWGKPYYRASLHQDGSGRHTQHNTLIGLVSSSAAALYVSPCFATNNELRTHFGGGRGMRVLEESVLAPLSGVPPIYDTDTHSITYPDDASAFRVHSDPEGPYATHRSIDEALASLEDVEWGEPHFEKLRDELHGALARHEIQPPEPPDGTAYEGPLSEVAAILDQTLGAVMALIPTQPGAR